MSLKIAMYSFLCIKNCNFSNESSSTKVINVLVHQEHAQIHRAANINKLEKKLTAFLPLNFKGKARL